MAFSYQKNFGLPTENVSHELMFSLLRDHNAAWMVDKIREIKSTAHERDWTQEREYQLWFERLPEDQRKALESKSPEELAKAWADGLKKDLALITFIGNFDETWSNPRQKPGKPKKEPKLGRWRKKDGLRLNGLCVMDLDHVVKSHNPDDVRQWWAQVSAHLDLIELGIKMVYVSASGDGLKVVFAARMEWGNNIDNQHKMAELLGIPQFVDDQCKDGSRGHFITTEQDVIFMDENNFYDYYNEAFDQKWTPEYRSGHSQPTLPFVTGSGMADSHPGGNTHQVAATADGDTHETGHEAADVLSYNGVPIVRIIEAWLDGKVPPQGQRHDTMRDLSRDIRYCLENTPSKIMKAFESQQWIQDLIAEGDPVETTVEGACKQRYYNSKPMRLKEALLKAGALVQESFKEAEPGCHGLSLCPVHRSRLPRYGYDAHVVLLLLPS